MKNSKQNFDDLTPVQMLARAESLIPNLVNDEIEHLDACSEATDILEFTKLSVVAGGIEDAIYSPSFSRGLGLILNHVQDKIQEGLTSTDKGWEAEEDEDSEEEDTPFSDDDDAALAE